MPTLLVKGPHFGNHHSGSWCPVKSNLHLRQITLKLSSASYIQGWRVSKRGWIGEEGLEGQEGTQRLVVSTLLFSQKRNLDCPLNLPLPLTHLATLDPFSSRTHPPPQDCQPPPPRLAAQHGCHSCLFPCQATSAPSSQNQPVKKWVAEAVNCKSPQCWPTFPAQEAAVSWRRDPVPILYTRDHIIHTHKETPSPFTHTHTHTHTHPMRTSRPLFTPPTQKSFRYCSWAPNTKLSLRPRQRRSKGTF